MTFLVILIAIDCVLLMLVVLIQNPKGGGLDATFGGSGANQILGAARSTDFMEKLTWYLAGALFILCLTTSLIAGSGSGENNNQGPRTNTPGTTGQLEQIEEMPTEAFWS